MASTVPNVARLGDPEHGGALFTLPREIRDEIYRLLVKRRYTVVGLPSAEDTIIAKPDMTILRISQAISREAYQIFYSSILRYQISFDNINKAVKAPAQPVELMKKVKMVIGGLALKREHAKGQLEYYRRIEKICEATIDKFTNSQILRDDCHVQFPEFSPDMITFLQSFILPKLAIFTGFRTLQVEFFLEGGLDADIEAEMDIFEKTGSVGKILRGWGSIKQAIRHAMEPTLGPAQSCGNLYIIRLNFHPREHVPSILRAQAQKLLLDADRLEQDDRGT